jgi:hypothetical protein
MQFLLDLEPEEIVLSIGLSLVYRSKGDDKAAIKRVKSDTRINCAERKQARLIG